MNLPWNKSPLGSRAQIGALDRAIKDVNGNRDGIANNEDAPAHTAPEGLSSKNPLLNRLDSAFDTGLSTRDEETRIRAFVGRHERRWGQPATNLRPNQIEDFERFRAEKSVSLARFQRRPGDVTDGFVKARGTVDGKRIAPRDIFIQHWRPVGEPSGKVVVLSPGFQETGRNFYEQIDLLNRQGHAVVVMDHQWAGHSEGKPGGIDRGYGVARDVAAVAAHASQLAGREYGADAEVVLMGNSMGAGPGVLGALTLNDAGKIRLDGPQMPRGLDAILQAPFLDATPSALNELLGASGRIPGLGNIPLPSSGLPTLTKDGAAAAKLAQHVALEGVVARPQAMNAATADLGRIHDLIDAGRGPTGRIYMIHGDRDPLASADASKALAERLGDRAHLDLISSENHVLEESPTEQRHVLDAMRWLGS